MVKVADLDEVRRLLDQEQAQLVEVLPRAEYGEEHLPARSGSRSRNRPRPADVLDPARPVTVYCYDWLCDTSPRAAARLERLGLARVYDYAAGKVATCRPDDINARRRSASAPPTVAAARCSIATASSTAGSGPWRCLASPPRPSSR